MEMFISYGISGILFVVFILQLIVYRGTKLSYKTLQNKLDEEQRRYAILENKINQLYNEQTNLVVAKELAIEKLNTQTDANNQLQQRILQLIQENKQLELKRNSLQDELSILIADKAALIQINKAHHELINKQDAILTQVKNQLSEQFSNISKQTLNTLFERSQVELANSQTNLTAQVKTLMDHYNKINDEKEKNINNLTQPIKQQLDVLNVELVKINHSSKSLDEDTKKLISALKGDSKIRGDFGEMQLRNLVENAGLTDYCDFTTQTTTVDDNRPDMILRMPHKHALVIDSKNLTRLYWDLQDELDNQTKISQLITKVKDVIKQLGQKQYQESVSKSFNLEALDYVILFLPNEAMFSFVLKHDETLNDYAMANRVLVVSPIILLALFKVVESLWTTNKMADTAQVIHTIGQKIYDKLIMASEHMQRLGKSLDDAGNKYNDVLKSMWNGRDNLRNNTEKLRDLNIKNIGLKGEKSVADLEPIAIKSIAMDI